MQNENLNIVNILIIHFKMANVMLCDFHLNNKRVGK